MDRFDKFTDRARKVLTLAQDEAQRFNHNYIGTEHLLLGLVREGEGVAARVLENMNVELAKVRTAVIHADRSQEERETALRHFRQGKVRNFHVLGAGRVTHGGNCVDL